MPQVSHLRQVMNNLSQKYFPGQIKAKYLNNIHMKGIDQLSNKSSTKNSDSILYSNKSNKLKNQSNFQNEKEYFHFQTIKQTPKSRLYLTKKKENQQFVPQQKNQETILQKAYSKKYNSQQNQAFDTISTTFQRSNKNGNKKEHNSQQNSQQSSNLNVNLSDCTKKLFRQNNIRIEKQNYSCLRRSMHELDFEKQLQFYKNKCQQLQQANRHLQQKVLTYQQQFVQQKQLVQNLQQMIIKREKQIDQIINQKLKQLNQKQQYFLQIQQQNQLLKKQLQQVRQVMRKQQTIIIDIYRQKKIYEKSCLQ